jgi:histidinol phosphatase-like PHP family hydrolase
LKTLNLILIADLHYVGPEGTARPLPERKGKLALELALRALREARRHFETDAVVVLGDLVEDGGSPHADREIAEIRATLCDCDVPLLVVAGNHDRDQERIAGEFDCAPGLHRLEGWRLLLVSDAYDGEERCRRSAQQRSALERLAGGDGPLIVVQHPPLLPRITADYPYTLENAEEVASDYARAGVRLSLSGHYHAGQAPSESEGVTYFTCPALCERPFRYASVRLREDALPEIETRALAPAGLRTLFDAHMHTQFAHCAEDTSVAGVLERMDAFEIPHFGIVEHADQLYFPAEGFWDRTDGNQLDAARKARDEGHARHERFRREVLPLRSDRVFVGLECESEAGGKGLAIFDEDREGYDYLIGGIHYLGKADEKTAPQQEIVRRFAARTEQLARSGIEVLAHPFRYFRRHRRPVPTRLYRPVAELLKAEGVAAEINFHSNRPDPEFYAICLELGVRLSVGSDAHNLREIGDLLPHLELLRELGVAGRLEDVLWRPARLVAALNQE